MQSMSLMKRQALTLLLSIIFVGLITPAYSQNLLTNAGFEGTYTAVPPISPGDCTGYVASSWYDNTGWDGDAVVAYSQDTTTHYSGASSQKIVVSAGFSQLQQDLNFQAGRYSASIYVKAASPTWVSFGIRELGSPYAYYAVTCLRATTSWTQITVTGITPAVGGTFVFDTAGPGTVWVDSGSAAYQGVNPTPVSFTPPASSVPSTYFGLHPQHLALLGNGPLPWPSVGFGYARSHDCAPTWAQIETSNGTYNWQNLDNFVNSARAGGQKILYTFSETPQWATTDTIVDAYGYVGGNGVPSNMSYWTSFVSAVVNRYKGEISAYEIWNEPNTEFWDGTAAQMAQMETTAAPIIHSTDTSALVTCAAYSINNNPQNLAACEQYFAAGGGSDSDVLSFHLYDPTPEDDISCINAIKSLAAAYGYSSKPIWNTETGWGYAGTGTGNGQQAMSQTVAYVPRSYVLDWVMGITNFDWYAWSDASNVGVTENSGGDWTVLTPGAVSYQQVGSWLNGATVTSCTLDGNGNWVAKTSTSSGVAGWIIWNNDASYNYPVPSGATTEYDTAGDILSLSGVSTVAVGGTPIYITTGGESKANTTTNLSSSLNPSTSGASVTLTATVTGSSPTGTVQFAIDGSNVGSAVTLSLGSASYSTSSLAVGTHTVTATYSGNTSNAGSSGTLSPSQVVNAAAQGVPVSLSSYYNCIGITNNSAPTLGNIDGSGYSYSAQLIGSQSLTIGGVPFTLGPFTNSTNNVITGTGQTIPLTSGSYGTLYLLACAVNNDQLGQAFSVHYTSGSPTTGSFNISNWGSNGEGNVVAQAMASRNGPNGTVTFNVDIYEFSLPLNSSGTVSSLQLPSNSQVKILAATLVPSGGLTSTTTTVSSSLNPSTSSASVKFTATVTGASPTGTVQFAIDGSSTGSPVTLSAGTASYSTSSLAVGTHTVTATYSGNTSNAGSSGTLSPSQVVNAAAQGVPVSLSSYYNCIGITNNSAPTLGNIDGSGYSYSAQLIGSQSLTIGGVPFTLGPFTNSTNNVITGTGQTIPLTSGSYGTLYLLACAVNNDQLGQAFSVHYTSGSPTTGSFNISNWGSNGEGNVVAQAMASRNGPNGTVTFNVDIYEFSLPLNSSGTVSSLQLPSNSQVKILAATLVP